MAYRSLSQVPSAVKMRLERPTASRMASSRLGLNGKWFRKRVDVRSDTVTTKEQP